MKFEVDMNEHTMWTVLWVMVFICISVLIATLHLKTLSDERVQTVLAEQGHSPMSISCAYNISAPVCMNLSNGGY